jgi:branched-subunit amino acid ABC-type transport system permease component
MWGTIEVVLIYSLVLGALYLLVSLRVSIICGVLRIFHLGYAYLFALSVYLTRMLTKELGWGLIPALLDEVY